MPIYAYKCESCGHRQDVLQKMSDPLLTVCPSCSGATFTKQVTAAGFQLKGSGWYVTDFRDGKSSAKAETKPDSAPDTAAPAADGPKPAAGKPAEPGAAAPAAQPSPAPSPAPAPAPTPSAKT